MKTIKWQTNKITKESTLKEHTPEIFYINHLIGEYNENKSPVILQRLSTCADLLYKKYQDDYSKEKKTLIFSKEGRPLKRIMDNARTQFMEWYSQKPIEHEINILLQSQKEDRKGESGNISLETWRRSTKSRSFLGKEIRSPRYENLDEAIAKVELAKQALDVSKKSKTKDKKYHQALTSLYHKISYCLNYETKDKDKIRHLKQLLSNTDQALNAFLKDKPNLCFFALEQNEKDELYFTTLPQFTKEQYFLSIAEKPPSLESFLDWGTSLEEPYQNIYGLINNVVSCQKKLLKRNPNEKLALALNEALINLHNETTNLLRDDLVQLPDDRVPMTKQMKKALEKLLDSTNFNLNTLSFEYPVIKEMYQPNISGPITSDELVIKLVKTMLDDYHNQKGFKLDNCHITYLGGKNNKNWQCTNHEKGSTTTLRLENAVQADCFILDRMKDKKRIRQYLAKDDYYLSCTTNQIDYHIISSEYFSKNNLLTYCCKKNNEKKAKNPNTYEKNALALALDLTRKVAILAQDFYNCGFGCTDIKSGNFLLRDNDTIVITDTKGIVLIDKTHCLPANNDLQPTFNYAPPEDQAYGRKAEAFMVYEIGLMLYELIVTPNWPDEKKTWLEDWITTREAKPDQNPGECLNFELSAFQSPEGLDAMKLIKDAINVSPSDRPSLQDIIQTCNKLVKSLVPKKVFNQTDIDRKDRKSKDRKEQPSLQSPKMSQ